MKNVFFVCMLTTGLCIGCGEDVFGAGGAGGAGPTFNSIAWDLSDYTVTSDECDLLDGADAVLAFTISATDGVVTVDSGADSVVTDTPIIGVDPSYEVGDASVDAPFSEEVSPMTAPDCTAMLQDTFTLDLDMPTESLADNTTVGATWTHTETDVSAIPGDCDGEWLRTLPCTSVATFTLTQATQ
jgi:hypothetical protein